MADIQNKTEHELRDVNGKVDAQEHDSVNKDDVSQKVVAEFKSTMADLPWTPDQEDMLGMESFRNAIIDYIRNSDTPFTMALQGERGSGKTSVMHAIKYKLCDCKDSQYYGIWVDAWKFSVLDSPFQIAISILKAFIKQISMLSPNQERYNKIVNLIEKVGISLNALYNSIGGIVLQEHGVIKKITDKAIKAIKIVWEKFKNRDANDKAELVEQLKNEINELVAEVLKENNSTTKKGFLFFIDNLDRINPKMAVESLDLIKNFFDFKNCVFVVTLDYTFIANGVEFQFNKVSFNNLCEYNRFLDRYFNIVIPINTGFYDTELFLKRMLGFSFFDNCEWSDSDLGEFDLAVRRTVGASPRLVKQIINRISFLSLLSSHINQLIQGELSKTEQSNDINQAKLYLKVDRKVTFILCCMQVAYPDIYNLLNAKPYFRSWDDVFVCQTISPIVSFEALTNIMKLNGSNLNEGDRPEEDWEYALFRICTPVGYLSNNFVNILKLLRSIDSIYTKIKPNGDYGDLISQMFDFIDRKEGVNKSLDSIIKSRSL